MRGGRVALFGGTTEGRILAEWLAAEGVDGLLFVATEYGARLSENACAGLAVRIGRLEKAQMEELFREEKIGLVIDATHPYARQVTANIRAACEKQQIPLLRCLREGMAAGEAAPAVAGGTPENAAGAEKSALAGGAPAGERLIRFADMEQAALWLSGTTGNILFTTGSRDLAAFSQIDRERMYVRVLPAETSLAACRRLGIEGRHVIAMQGPFSEELNLALLAEFSCRILVTKDGGSQGGFEQKRRAAARAGAVLAVVERPGETGFSMEEVMERVREWRRHETEGR